MTTTVSCPSCDTSFPIDPAKVPPEGVRAQCSVCPEIFDVDRPTEAAPEAPPPSESMADTIETVDPLETGTVDLPPIEGASEGVAETADDSAVAVEAGSAAPVRFGRRSPADKAKSLARSLVSDLIAYNPEKHKEAVAGGNLQEVFSEEIEKSLKEYQQQVEPEVIAEGSFFNDAVNSILAGGKTIFSLDE